MARKGCSTPDLAISQGKPSPATGTLGLAFSPACEVGRAKMVLSPGAGAAGSS